MKTTRQPYPTQVKPGALAPRPQARDALAMWTQLHGYRRGLMTRFEDYAALTIPKVCLPDNVHENTASIQHDWTSVGAQATNHLVNKIVLSLFRPGMPFFRLDADDKLLAQMKQLGVKEEDLRASLVSGEQRALRVLDQQAVRPKLNEAVRSLVVVGNVAFDMSEKDQTPRTIGIRNYVVKRSVSGRPMRIIHREKVLWDELADEVRAVVPRPEADGNLHAYVQFFRWYEWEIKGSAKPKWHLTLHVDSQQLDESFDQWFTEDNMPFRALTWDLADEHDYGTGLVEDMAGDFNTLSTLSESEIKAAILASDYRWLANPASVGDVNEFKTTVTGDVVTGAKDDLSLVTLVSTSGLELISKSADKVIQRIGAAFLLQSAVTRDAERVTAEEIRAQANELETSLGGVYSRLAVDLQIPLVHWLMSQINVNIHGTNLVPTIVTGLAALDRNAEAQQLQLFLQDLGQIALFPPELSGRLQLENIISTLASAHGIMPQQYVKPEAQYQAEQAQAASQQQNQQQQEIASTTAMRAGARKLVQQNTPPSGQQPAQGPQQ